MCLDDAVVTIFLRQVSKCWQAVDKAACGLCSKLTPIEVMAFIRHGTINNEILNAACTHVFVVQLCFRFPFILAPSCINSHLATSSNAIMSFYTV